MEYGQVLLWIGLFGFLSVLGYPLASAVFGHLPGRGAGFAPTVALGTVSLVAYWVGYLRFGVVALAVGLLVLVAGDALAYRRGVELDWRAFAEAMAVFGLAFCFLTAIRAVDPGILPYLEDFLDYGMMRSILRSSHLPPEDFWFAGTRARYHFGGHLVAALMTMLTGTPPAIAYNLALAGFFAMLLSGTYELAGAIAAVSGRSRQIAGALAVYFVGFAGNLLVPTTALVQTLPRPVGSALAALIASGVGKPAAEFLVEGFSEYQYWDVLQTVPATLTPYPLFSWLHGELHAHMTSAPFFLLVVAVCYAYYRASDADRTRRRLLAFVAVPLATGFTVLTDVMTIPTSLGVIALTLIFAPAATATLVPARVRTRVRALRPTRLANAGQTARWFRLELREVAVALGVTGVLAGLVVAVSAPFLVFSVSGGSESVALVPADARTGYFALLLVHGTFLAVFVPYLVGRVWPVPDVRSRELRVAGTLIAPAVTIFAILVEAPVLLVVAPVVLVGWYALYADRARFETVLVVAGAGLVVLVDFFYIANQEYVIDGRGNTVFRMYWHTWLLWGVAAGVMLPRLVNWPDVSLRRPSRETGRAMLVVGLLLTSGVYGGVSVFNHFDRAFEPPKEPWEQAEYVYEATQMQNSAIPPTQPPTVNGLLYAEVKHPNETAAIKWFDSHVDGTPTIVTAPGGRWEWRSAPAALTGVPTVAGWGHELVYRDWDTYYDRVDDVRTIYRGTPARRIALLERYDVRYVYVGPDERERYDVWEFSLLDGVSVAYVNPEAVIYRVQQDALGYTPSPVATIRFDATAFGVNDAVATRRDGRIVATNADANGTLAWWGPYERLPRGEYVARFTLTVNATEAQPRATGDPVVVVDVARGALRNGTADFRVLGNASVRETVGRQTVSVSFTLTQPVADVEFRGRFANRTGTVTLHDVTVERTSANETGKMTPATLRP